MELLCAQRRLNLTEPKIMAVLNITPDSFSDGGKYYAGGQVLLDAVLHQAEAMLAAGAHILDVGGESTRPGASPVSSNEECDRVLPVVAALAERFDALISVDTSNPLVIKAAGELGAGLINDVRALTQPGALDAFAQTSMAVCLMHMQGAPANMQVNPTYASVTQEVAAFLAERVQDCERMGVARPRILLDPGIGFGKTDEHNLALLNDLPELGAMGYPLLVGLSRKSMIGRLLGRPLAERLAGTLGFNLVALQRGAKILRVHDVAETADIVKIYQLTAGSGQTGEANT